MIRDGFIAAVGRCKREVSGQWITLSNNSYERAKGFDNQYNSVSCIILSRALSGFARPLSLLLPDPSKTYPLFVGATEQADLGAISESILEWVKAVHKCHSTQRNNNQAFLSTYR